MRNRTTRRSMRTGNHIATTSTLARTTSLIFRTTETMADECFPFLLPPLLPPFLSPSPLFAASPSSSGPWSPTATPSLSPTHPPTEHNSATVSGQSSKTTGRPPSEPYYPTAGTNRSLIVRHSQRFRPDWKVCCKPLPPVLVLVLHIGGRGQGCLIY